MHVPCDKPFQLAPCLDVIVAVRATTIPCELKYLEYSQSYSIFSCQCRELMKLAVKER